MQKRVEDVEKAEEENANENGKHTEAKAKTEALALDCRRAEPGQCASQEAEADETSKGDEEEEREE